MVSGCHSTNSAFLLIDRSAKSVESFLPSRSRTWRRSRKHQSLAHTANSSRDSSRGSRRRHPLWTHLDSHVEAVVFCLFVVSLHLTHRRLALQTQLELRLEACCRSSVFVDSSRLVSYPLPLGHFSVVSPYFHSCCTAGLLLTRHLVVLLVCWSSLPLLGFDSPSPCAFPHKVSVSVCIVWTVADSFLLESHCLH